MDHQEVRRRFAALTTAHLADACIRAQVPVRCAPALLRAAVPGSRLAGGCLLPSIPTALPVFSLGAIPAGPLRLDVRPQDALESATVGTGRSVGRTWSQAMTMACSLPAIRAADIFTLAETIRDTERRQANRIRAGVSLRSQVQFDTYLARRQQKPSLSFREHLRAVGGAM